MSTYSPSLGLEEITPGDQAGLWGDTTNNNLNLIDQAITGVQPISFAGVGGTTQTLVATDGSITSTARSAVLNITGTATASNTVIVPNKQKTYLVRNNTTQDVIFATASPTATYTVGAGNSILIFCDGNNGVFTGILAPGSGTLGVAGGGTGATNFGTGGGFIVSAGGTAAFTSLPYVPVGGNQADLIIGQVQPTKGGTGLTSISTGSLIVGAGTGVMTVLPTGSTDQVLTSNGPGTAPTWRAAGSALLTSNNSWTGTNAFSTAPTVGGYNVLTTNTGAALSSSPTFTGTVSGSGFTATGAGSIGDQKFTVAYGGYSSGLSPTSIQLGSSGYGVIYSAGGAWDGSNGASLIISGGAGNLQITTSDTLFTGANNCFKQGSSTAWEISSDVRIKKNVTSYTKGLTELNQINIKNFEFNGLGNSVDGQKGIGVIADEIEQVLPDTVNASPIFLHKNDVERTYVKHFDATELTYLLVNAVKELSAKVDAQAAEIADLKG